MVSFLNKIAGTVRIFHCFNWVKVKNKKEELFGIWPQKDKFSIEEFDALAEENYSLKDSIKNLYEEKDKLSEERKETQALCEMQSDEIYEKNLLISILSKERKQSAKFGDEEHDLEILLEKSEKLREDLSKERKKSRELEKKLKKTEEKAKYSKHLLQKHEKPKDSEKSDIFVKEAEIEEIIQLHRINFEYV